MTSPTMLSAVLDDAVRGAWGLQAEQMSPAYAEFVGEARRLCRVVADPKMGPPNQELLQAVARSARAVLAEGSDCGERCMPCLMAADAAAQVLEVMKRRTDGVPAPKQSGDPCGKCGMFAMVWTGTCRTCGSCGESSGGC